MGIAVDELGVRSCKRSGERAAPEAVHEPERRHHSLTGVRYILDCHWAVESLHDTCAELAIPLVSTNLEWEVTSVNKYAEKLLGHRQFDVLGKPIELIIPVDQKTKHEAKMLRWGKSSEIVRPLANAKPLILDTANGGEVSARIVLVKLPAHNFAFNALIIRKELLEDMLAKSAELPSQSERFAKVMFRGLGGLTTQIQEKPWGSMILFLMLLTIATPIGIGINGYFNPAIDCGPQVAAAQQQCVSSYYRPPHRQSPALEFPAKEEDAP